MVVYWIILFLMIEYSITRRMVVMYLLLIPIGFIVVPMSYIVEQRVKYVVSLLSRFASLLVAKDQINPLV